MRIKIFKSEKKFIAASTNHILKIIKSASLRKSLVNIALSGGSTPVPIYKTLAKKLCSQTSVKSFFKSLNFYQVDERYVPAAHKDSNQKMIAKAFKNFAKKSKSSFHFFDTSLPIKKSLKEYSKKLPESFDLTILGVGPDGHTASLFPNTKNLGTKRAVMHTTTNTFAVHDRLTLSFHTILKSKTILILLKNKAKILAQLKNPPKSQKKIPVLKLLKHRHLHVFYAN